MKRDLQRLAANHYDVLVIGGGIYGACIARDAALRGLRAALIERGDFGNATSANSLKTIHGGLRYLQDGNLPLVREMIRERKTWLRTAPHLVHPLPFILPAGRSLIRSRFALAAALALADLAGIDRNRGIPPEQHILPGRALLAAEVRRLLPGYEGSGGAVMWYDAQVRHSERLLLAVLMSAVDHGAEVANYVEMVDFVRSGDRVAGVVARDCFSDQEIEISASVTINSTGPWLDGVIQKLSPRLAAPRFQKSLAVNLVTRQIWADYAVGGYSPRGQALFVVPWNDYSLIGTLHLPADDADTGQPVTTALVEDFVEQFNAAYAGQKLRLADVTRVHWGYLPVINGGDNQVRLLRESQIHDHEAHDGIAGAITVMGVKYTTARLTARQAVDLAGQKLGSRSTSTTHRIPVRGGSIPDLTALLREARSQRTHDLPPDTLKRLMHAYGTDYDAVLRRIEDDPSLAQPIADTSRAIAAEVVHAVHDEMAITLEDVVMRRTELGAGQLPDRSCLQACARIMGHELGWSPARQEQEIADLISSYPGVPAQAVSY